MNTTTQPKAPVRTDTFSFKPDRFEHLSTPAENRSEAISKETTETLKRKVKGQIVLPTDPNYDEVRQIWNAMIDRRPALIVRCAKASDVPHAISFARENGLEISIRGAGHNIAGNALCDNGLMIDLSTMRRVRVDAEKKRAYVEPGATLADFDEAAQSHGLATPVGINSTTGIAGLGVDPTVVSPGAIWWRDSRGYCLDCLMNSTRLKRRADQSSSIATWRTLSNPA